MKKIITLAFGICLLAGSVWAQTTESKFGVDSMKTVKNASTYTELLKQKKFKEALPGWRYVFHNAPKFEISTYTNGRELLVNMYAQTRDESYIDELMTMYDQQIKYFGDDTSCKSGFIFGEKGLYLYQYGRRDDKSLKEAYSSLLKYFEMNKGKAQQIMIQTLFLAASDLLKKDIILQEEYVNLYMELAAYYNNMIKQEPNSESYKRELSTILLNSNMECATLNNLLTNKYRANKEDVATLKDIESLLRQNGCLDQPLFLTVTEQLYRLEPTADAAYRVALLFMRCQDSDKAEIYLKEAIDKAKSDEARVDYHLRLAHIKFLEGQWPAVKASVMEILKVNPNNGQALLLLGQTYAAYSRNYGDNYFDHASVYWLAVDKLQKAKEVDPEVAKEANHLISVYSMLFPKEEDAFFHNLTSGATLKIGDWINETTTVRFLKNLDR